MKERMLCLLGAVVAATAMGGAYEIGDDMGGESFWKSDPVLFVNKHVEHGFKFTSEGREGADSRREGGVACFGLPVYESKVAFGEEGGIARVEMTLFNRGGTEDLEELALANGQKLRRIKRVEKEMTKEEFLKVVDAVCAKLTPAGKKQPKVERQTLKDTNIRQCTQVWPKTSIPTIATLTWNYEQGAKKTATFTPGFIRLVVEGPEAVAKAGSSKTPASMKAKKPGGAKLTDNVVKDSRGVFIDNVPMVDQGQKGYCAAASCERVLRYYGIGVDEHEIAVAADTTAEGGTSTSAMIASVTAIGKKHKLATAVLYGDADKGVNERIDNLADEVKQYNKAAKKLKKPLINDDDYITRSGNMITYSPAAVDAKMDVEVLKYLRVNRSNAQYKKFLASIRQYVNEGKPLIWGVTLGIYPETDLPQAKGGHMRLIIGYNDGKKKDGGEILYTDSWGKGHELKRMPADWAWTITHCLLGLRPLR